MKKVSIRTIIFIIVLLGLILTLSGCIEDQTVFGGDALISTLL